MIENRRSNEAEARSMLAPTGDIRDVVELGIQLQKEASKYNIHNVFDDGGYKELLLLKLFGLHKLGRTGDDAADDHGNRYEIKTVARVSASGERKKSLSITTEHTLTLENIKRYRAVRLWIIAVFDQADPEEIFEITPAALEPYFARWEAVLKRQEELRVEGGAPVHLNNRKIPLSFIQRHGTRIWPSGPMPVPSHVQEALEEASDLAE